MTTPTPEDDVKQLRDAQKYLVECKAGEIARAHRLFNEAANPARIARLLDHIEALELDAARWRAGLRVGFPEFGTGHKSAWCWYFPTTIGESLGEFKTANEAIDAAIASEAKP